MCPSPSPSPAFRVRHVRVRVRVRHMCKFVYVYTHYNHTTRVTCTVHCKSRNTEDIPGSGLLLLLRFGWNLCEWFDIILENIVWNFDENLMKFRRAETEISVWIRNCISAQIPGLVAESSSHGPRVRVRDRVMNLRVRVRDRVRHKQTRVRDRTRVTHHWV